MCNYYLAWWNLENLFDTEHSAARPDWLQKTLRNELAGWDNAILNRKISQLASIINRMNDGHGPDLLGVCEVENESVLTRLIAALQSTGRCYRAAHHGTSDKRGIDVAFIYDANRFTVEEQFFHIILKHEATRDLFQVNFRTQAGHDLIVVGNHWPSQSLDDCGPEPFRILAGETLNYWTQRIQQIKGADAAVVVMGDFHEEPVHQPMSDEAPNARLRTIRSETTRLHNLTWPVMGEALESHYVQHVLKMFDQLWVSCGFLQENAVFRVNEHSVTVIRFPEMLTRGLYPMPRRFGRPSAGLDLNGFSDHFPVGMVVTEAD